MRINIIKAYLDSFLVFFSVFKFQVQISLQDFSIYKIFFFFLSQMQFSSCNCIICGVGWICHCVLHIYLDSSLLVPVCGCLTRQRL
jgi:hypothetical protein